MTAGPQYRRRRARAIAYGQWQPWADPAPVRQHIARLRGQGGSYHGIARAAGVAARTVHALMTGEERIKQATADALLAITIDDVRHARLPAGGTRLRLRSLMAMGHDCTRMALAAGVHPATTRQLVFSDAGTVSPQLREDVRQLWEAWWDKTPPARTHRQRATAQAARARARRAGWCTPLALDEDLIDCIGYQPEHGWRPATGTGPAPEPEEVRARKPARATAPLQPSHATPASDYELGAAAAHLTVTGLAARGHSADQIADRHDETTALFASDGEPSDWIRGYDDAATGAIAALRDLERSDEEARAAATSRPAARHAEAS